MKNAVILAPIALLLPSIGHAQSDAVLYVGVEGGVDNYELNAEGDLGIFDPSLAGTTASFDGLSGNGATGKIYAGYQVPFNGGFGALEAFGGYSGASISASLSDGVDTYSAKIQARESYGVAARAGVKVSNSSAVYARLGWVNTRFKGTIDDSVDVFTDSSNEDAIQYGAGLDTMIGPKTSLRAEYVISDYGDAGLGSGVSLKNGAFHAGLSFRF
ncbi:outer membrane protein [Allopontixanthobacter sp.]|uniref:outer membrane protein n=1 Tax=Allopontixanthobacter sp. TaxID=2906452 RepID=UPI002AB9C95D|nr:outer membrane beta-barrel protein [Allopontixanthobacter sp.]MDZ4308264.1 outer membrane beta-barrel protein [Allopontixanthobacter sp.]